MDTAEPTCRHRALPLIRRLHETPESRPAPVRANYGRSRSDVARGARHPSELARQLTWSRTMVSLHHYRDRDGYEVDAILEDNAGRIIGIEAKAAETIRAEDFRGLQLLRRRLGDRFLAGFVLHCGEQRFSFGDHLACLPISALWTPAD
ncbi:DUF4143 domain-containing protein [Nocardia nova]|uniref:DUF4143 domain-containing protein n=1 Tax=Nocardia nova TaxID=37330 RepID=UPI0033F4958E